jgi:predicted SAM-dependent methyltransferase
MKCPVCDSIHLDSLIDLGQMPLSVLGLVTDPGQSVAGKCHTVDICICRSCGHVFNYGYDQGFVQPFEGGCTMYNNGGPWLEHMQKIAKYVCDTEGKIVEIGSGNGEFARLCDHANYVAYEPTADCHMCREYCKAHQIYFVPEDAIRHEMPDVIVMRHVLEHYAQPGEFLERMSKACRLAKCEPYLIIEVPNITNAMRDLRVEDWVYEHPQHFTPESLCTLARLHGWVMDDMFTTYNDEVIIARLTPYGGTFKKGRRHEFNKMKEALQVTRSEILSYDKQSHGSVVLWGGAGKGSTLINMLDLPSDSIPIIDSDERKWGKMVPGTDHMMVDPGVLNRLRPELVVVTTSWRVGDIAEEIRLKDLPVGRVASICQGKLKTYEG